MNELQTGFSGSRQGVARVAGIRLKPLPKQLKRRRKIRRHRVREFFNFKNFGTIKEFEITKCELTGLHFTNLQIEALGGKVSHYCDLIYGVAIESPKRLLI